MRALELTGEAQEDLDRLVDFVVERKLGRAAPDLEMPARALNAIRTSLEVLKLNPWLGRRAEGQLVIGFGSSGYIALYAVADDAIRVMAFRHQIESDYH